MKKDNALAVAAKIKVPKVKLINGQDRVGRPTKVVHEQRIKEVAMMILACKARTEIIDYCVTNYGLRETSVTALVTSAYKFIRESHSVDASELVSVHTSYYYECFMLAKQLGDVRGSVAALQAIEKLLKISQPDVAIQNNNLNVNLKDMTLSELKELIK